MDPGFKPVGIKSDPQPTLPCFPYSRGGRDSDVGRWRVKSVRHSQSFASEVWDKGQLTDFQELRLQRKKKAQSRAETHCQSLKSYQPWSSAPSPSQETRCQPLTLPWHGSCGRKT